MGRLVRDDDEGGVILLLCSSISHPPEDVWRRAPYPSSLTVNVNAFHQLGRRFHLLSSANAIQFIPRYLVAHTRKFLKGEQKLKTPNGIFLSSVNWIESFYKFSVLRTSFERRLISKMTLEGNVPFYKKSRRENASTHRCFFKVLNSTEKFYQKFSWPYRRSALFVVNCRNSFNPKSSHLERGSYEKLCSIRYKWCTRVRDRGNNNRCWTKGSIEKRLKETFFFATIDSLLCLFLKKNKDTYCPATWSRTWVFSWSYKLYVRWSDCIDPCGI